MTIAVLMPALSPTMEEGNLAKWKVKEGDVVKAGDVLAEIETDKATMEVEAVDEGVLGKILIGEGTQGVKVNTPIAVLLEDGESKADAEKFKAAPAANDSKKEPKATVEKKTSRTVKPTVDRPVQIAPEEGAYAGELKEMAGRDALNLAMCEEMRVDEKVFLIGEEVAEYDGAYKVSRGMLAEFGARRVIDTPITEHGFAGIGVGAAFYGLKPIVEFMTMNFALQAIDQIVNSAAKTLYMSGGQMGCPIVFRGPNSAPGRVGAQHSQCFASWYGHIPGLKVVAPYSGADAKGLLKAAIRDPNPVIFLEHEILYGENFMVPTDPDFIVPIGKAKVVREGSDVTIIAYGIMVKKSLQAAEMLAQEGIDAEVIDLRTIRPLDVETIVNSIKKTNRVVSAEESWPFAGMGSEIAAVVMERAFDWLDAPLVRVCHEDVPLPYAANLEQMALPQAEDVAQAAIDLCYREI